MVFDFILNRVPRACSAAESVSADIDKCLEKDRTSATSKVQNLAVSNQQKLNLCREESLISRAPSRGVV
jgi:hypothetical protein